MGKDQPDRDDEPRASDESTSADGRGGLPVSEQAQNAEMVLDPDLDPDEPGEDSAESVERLEQHSQPTDTPAHPESPARPDAPPRS